MSDKYTVAKIEESFLDYPDFESIATVVYFTGCENKCFNCHNNELSVPKIKDVVDHNKLINRVKIYCQNLQTNKIVLLGGEPLQQKNILKFIKDLSSYDICLYTGYNFTKAKNILTNHIKYLRYLKVGKYNYNLNQSPQKNEIKREIVLSSKNQAMYKITDTIDKISINGYIYFNKD